MRYLASGDCSGTPFSDLCGSVDQHLASGQANVVDGVLARVVWPLAALVVTWLLARLARGIAERALERTEADAQVRTLVHNLLVVIGGVVAFSFGLWAAGVNFSIFLTVGGLTSLVVGLAFQDLLRNVLAGLFILLERPFRIGDVIVVGDLTGSVVTIELRTTALRLGDGRLAVIPNLQCFSTTVINVTAFDRRRFAVSLWVPSGTDLERLSAALQEQLAATPEAASEPAPRVQPATTLDGGVTLSCELWLAWRDCDPDAVQADLVRRLYAAAEQVIGHEVTAPPTPQPRRSAPREPSSAEEDGAGLLRLPRRRRRRPAPATED